MASSTKWVKIASGGYRRLSAYTALRADNYAGVGWSLGDGVTANRFDVVYADQAAAEAVLNDLIASEGIVDLD